MSSHAPERIQLRRSRGWRKPAGAIVVSRPSRWGNPFRIGVDGDRATCAARFRRALLAGALAFSADDVRDELAGHDLACWCARDEACHADTLLEIANANRTARVRRSERQSKSSGSSSAIRS